MRYALTISMPEDLAKEIDRHCSVGHFGSRSEFIRVAIREYLYPRKNQKSTNSIDYLPSNRNVA